MKLGNLIKYCDFCSIGPELRINNSRTLKSVVGGLVSMIILLVVIFLVFYLGRDIIYKEKPSLLTIDRSLDTPIYKELNNTNFIIGLKVVDYDISTFPNPESYFDITFANVKTFANPDLNSSVPWNWTQIDLGYVPCNHYKNYAEKDKVLVGPLNSFSCPKNFDIFFGGQHSDSLYGEIYVKLDICKNTTVNPHKCATESEIENVISEGAYLVIYYRDYVVNPKDASFPISFFQQPLIIPISSVFHKEYKFYYKNLQVVSDFGFLFEDLVQIDSMKVNNNDVEYKENFEKTLSYAEVTISLLNQATIYERKYLKIQELAANVGGMVKFLMIISTLVLWNLNNKQISVSLMNQMYDFSQQNEMDNFNEKLNVIDSSAGIVYGNQAEPSRLNPNLKPSLTSKFRILGQSISSIKDSTKQDMISRPKLSLEGKFHIIYYLGETDKKKTIAPILIKGRRKNSKLTYSPLEEMMDVFCPKTYCKSRSYKMKDCQYNLCKEQIKVQLNFDCIVKKLNEIEFLKAVLLNKEQIISFDYFEKSLVSSSKDSPVDNRLMTDIHQTLGLGEDKHLEMLSYYFESLTPDISSSIDEKIKKLLDSSI